MQVKRIFNLKHLLNQHNVLFFGAVLIIQFLKGDSCAFKNRSWEISLKYLLSCSSKVFWRICFRVSMTSPSDETGMIMVSGLSCPKTRTGIRKRKRNVSEENVLGYIMPPPLEVRNFDQRQWEPSKSNFIMGSSGAVRVRRRNFFHRHHWLHLNWLFLCISKSFSKFSADRLRLQTHTRFKRSYDKYYDKITSQKFKITVSHLLAITSKCWY